MLTIIVKGTELYDDNTNKFIKDVEDVVLEFEHSLVSLSKWESKYEKPFLGNSEKTPEEIFGYIEAMLLTPNISEEVFSRLTSENLEDINQYIESKKSATTFSQLTNATGPKETITAELIYYWLVALTIPFEVETWHLNRLFSLIQICGIKNNNATSKSKKPTKASMAARRELNAQRKAQLGTTG